MSNSKTPAADDDISICPPWWPFSLWKLHFPPGIIHPHGPGPINLPPVVNEILLNLQVHTTSYLNSDQAAAKQMRKLALDQIEGAVHKLRQAQ